MINPIKEKTEPKKTINDIKIPTFYSPTYDELWKKETSGFHLDAPILRLQAEALRILQRNRNDIERVNSMKDAALEAFSENEAMVKISDFADKSYERIKNRSSALEDKAINLIKQLNAEIENDIEQTAASSRNEDRILNYLLNKRKPNERSLFIRKAIQEGHKETMASIIANPAFLSGLSNGDHKHYKNIFVKNTYPDKYASIQLAKKIQDHVGKGFLAFQSNLSNVVDTPDFKDAKSKMEAFRDTAEFD